MNYKAFPLTPLALAISAALLLGCSTDKISVADLNAQPAEPAHALKAQNHPPSPLPSTTEADQAQSASQQRAEIHPGRIAQPPMQSQTLEAKKHLPQTRQLPNETALTMPLYAPLVQAPQSYSEPERSNERFASFSDNSTRSVAAEPLSTFGADVDTASYAIARQDLNNGRLPTPESVRVEEWLNYFDYSYAAPIEQQQPFSVTTEIAPSPWDKNKQLLLIGLKGYEVAKADLPPLNLTFLIDVSGSMQAQNKLPLAKTALKMLTQQLRPQDRVSIVVYAGAAGLVLDSASGEAKSTIIQALDQLRSGGSTAGGAGIQLAYSTARKNHNADAISRVILLTDGDMNVGTSSTEALKKMVAQQRSSGVSLSVLSFGRGNIRDELMNSLAEIGNGNAGYIDSAHEARKYLVDQMSGSLMTIAKDVKTQIEFNGEQVSEYRLLGYETRALQNHEFNDDRKDAGEIGAGHSVTALYELTLKDSAAELTPSLRYNLNLNHNDRPDSPAAVEADHTQELAYLKLRYKQPDGERSQLISQPIYLQQMHPSLDASSENFRWAAAVAGAAQRARGNPEIGNWGYSQSLDLAQQAQGSDSLGYRAEFIRMLRMAASLGQSPQQLSRAD